MRIYKRYALISLLIALVCSGCFIACSSGGGGGDDGGGSSVASCLFGPVNPGGLSAGVVSSDPSYCQCPAQATANGDGTYTCR